MAQLKTELRFIPCGNPAKLTPFVVINGRQALEEGPRRVGHCIYCKDPCRGATENCGVRVYQESRLLP